MDFKDYQNLEIWRINTNLSFSGTAPVNTISTITKEVLISDKILEKIENKTGSYYLTNVPFYFGSDGKIGTCYSNLNLETKYLTFNTEVLNMSENDSFGYIIQKGTKIVDVIIPKNS